MVVIAIVRHRRYFDVLPLELLPEVDPEVLEPVEPVPLLEPEPAPVSVVVTEELGGVVVVVMEVVSLVVGEVVGVVVEVVVEVEPGVALVPELLYEVLASLWQPGRPAAASARRAT